jgi:hypothetical protein
LASARHIFTIGKSNENSFINNDLTLLAVVEMVVVLIFGNPMFVFVLQI